MAVTLVASGGNESYSAAGSPSNCGTYSLQTNDTLLVVTKWEGSVCSPALALQGANLGKSFVSLDLMKHPTLNVWYRGFYIHKGFSNSTNEQLICDFDVAGGGRPGWAAGVIQMRGVPDPGFLAMNFNSRTAPGSGATALASGAALSIGAGDGIIVQVALLDDDAGALSLFSGFTALSFNTSDSGGTTYFKRGQQKIYSTSSGAVTPSASVANPVNMGLLTFSFGTSPASNPTVHIGTATQDGADLVVQGTHTQTGSATITVTITPTTGSPIVETADILTSTTWSVRFIAPPVSVYGVGASITDTIGTGTHSISGVSVIASTLAAPVITSAPSGPSPIIVSGTGLAACTIDIRKDSTDISTGVATVAATNVWTTSVALSTGSHTIEARQNTVVADGVPPTPGPLLITPQADPLYVDFTFSAPAPWTKANLFYGVDGNTADGDLVLVGSVAAPGTKITLTNPESGAYRIGTENNNGNPGSPWYSHKSDPVTYTRPGSGEGSGGGGDTDAPIPTTDTGNIITWITPDTAWASTRTDGLYQVDRASPADRNVRGLPNHSAGVTTGGNPSTHSAVGILYPGGSGGDQAYALSRTTLNGKPRYHHRVGNNLPVAIGTGTTYRSEMLQFGGSIALGQEWLMGGLLRFDSNMMAVGAPFCSYFDLHHEQYSNPNYGGPGPIGIYGDRNVITIYYSRVNEQGNWQNGITLHTWTPQADFDYWIVIHGKQHYQAGQGAFLRFYLVINDAAAPTAPTKQWTGTWGVDNRYSNDMTMYWKQGIYFWNGDGYGPGPGAGPFSRKSAGLIVVKTGGSIPYTPGRMLATLRGMT